MRPLPFAWEVKKNRSVSYLIGTSHYIKGDELVDRAKPFVDSVDTLFFEADDAFELQPHHRTLPDGQTIADFLEPEQVEDVMAFFREFYQETLLPAEVQPELDAHMRQKLWWLHSHVLSLAVGEKEKEYMIAMKRLKEIAARFDSIIVPSAQELVGLKMEAKELAAKVQQYEQDSVKIPTLDNAIRAYALSQGKQVRGLDIPDEYAAIYDTMSVESQRKLLLEGIDDARNGLVFKEVEMGAYERGDLREVIMMLMPDDPADKELLDTAGDKRSAAWYPRTRQAFEEGGVLLAAGLSHMINNYGYVPRLGGEGFEVTRIE
jgi:uncharacterized protein YbaP (TraB family)